MWLTASPSWKWRYGGQPQLVEPLMCGHHFRLSQWTLAATGAMARAIAGRFARRVSELALP